MTGLGILTLCICVVIFFLPWRWAISGLFLTTTWTAGSVIKISDTHLLPFELVLFCMGLRLLFTTGSGPMQNRAESRGKPDSTMFYFVIIVIISYACAWSLIGPHVFAGVTTMLPRLGLDSQANALSTLEFGVSNMAQSVYWLAHGLFLLVFLWRSVIISRVDILAGMTIGSIPFLILSSWEILAIHLGFYFPYDFFHNNNESDVVLQTYMGLERLVSTLPEPSMLAGTITPICIFFLLRYLLEGGRFFLICGAGGDFGAIIVFHGIYRTDRWIYNLFHGIFLFIVGGYSQALAIFSYYSCSIAFDYSGSGVSARLDKWLAF